MAPKPNYIKKYLPHIIAFLLFTIFSFAYFFPVLEGKVLKANDSIVAKVNMQEIVEHREREGEEALWTNSIFSGMPAYLISTKHPGNLWKKIDILLQSYGRPVAFVFISMLSFYMMLLMFGVNPYLAIVGALAFGFSPYLIQVIAAGHNSKAMAISYLPLVIGGVYYAYKRKATGGAIIFGIGLALQLGAGHPQITYYAFICILIMLITELIFSVRNKEFNKFSRTSLILIIPLILAVGINFSQLYTTYEYGEYSMRGKSDLVSENNNVSSSGLDPDYITQWSYGIGETMNLLIPNFKGGSSRPFDNDSEIVRTLRNSNNAAAAPMFMKYWGSQPSTEGPNYQGAAMIFLFVLGLFLLKGAEKWWLLVATLLSIMLAWGHNFMWFTNIFINFFPGYNKFRAVTMILVIVQFCVPLMAILALKEILSGKLHANELKRGLLKATVITGGTTLLFIIAPSLAGSFISGYETEMPDWVKTALIADRKSLLISDAARSLIFILLAAGVLYALIAGKLKERYAIVLLGLIIVVDLWGADKRYLGADRFDLPNRYEQTFSPTMADQYILRDESNYRVLNMAVSTFNDNSTTSYFHHSIGGYHGAKMQRYQELIDSAMYENLVDFSNAASSATMVSDLAPALEKTTILNMLNTKYIIYNPEAPPILNEHALGNAWFVEKAIIVENANEEINLIQKIDPGNEAVIDDDFEDMIAKREYQTDSINYIELTSYKPNELIYSYKAETDQLAIFSEIYYPKGWECYIDGEESSHFRANYVLRGMELPAGSHEVRFQFDPPSYRIGTKVSYASSIIMLLMAIAYLLYPKFGSTKNYNTEK
ncbi:MAG: YfhO family protein [Bacteroidales bacterium]|jgi:hypothetical protein